MESSNPIISFKEADIINGEATIIYGFNVDIHEGDFVYIVGKSEPERRQSSGQ